MGVEVGVGVGWGIILMRIESYCSECEYIVPVHQSTVYTGWCKSRLTVLFYVLQDTDA